MAEDLQVSQSLEAREDWIENELAGCEFADVRHGKRLGKLLEKISFGQGSSMPWAFQDWANTKAAYRFFANGRVDEATILGGHFKATRARFESARDAGPALTTRMRSKSKFARPHLYARVRRTVLVEGMSRRAAAREFCSAPDAPTACASAFFSPFQVRRIRIKATS
jgi:hypothetical protein